MKVHLDSGLPVRQLVPAGRNLERGQGERMGTRCRFLPSLLVSILALGLTSCNSTSSSSSSTSSPGALYVSTQGDSLVSAYTIDVTTGLLTSIGSGVATGGAPSAMILTPSGTALFIVNSGTNEISTYTVKSDGTVSANGSN